MGAGDLVPRLLLLLALFLAKGKEVQDDLVVLRDKLRSNITLLTAFNSSLEK